MRTTRSWTEYERQVVVKKLQKYPHNFTMAFQEAAIELERSLSAVQNQFYKDIKPTLNKHNIVVTAQGSAHGLIVNSKNIARKKDSADQLDMIMSFVNLLSKEQKKIIATEIFKGL